MSSQGGLEYVEQLWSEGDKDSNRNHKTWVHVPTPPPRLCDFEPSPSPLSLDSPSGKCVSWQLLCLFAGIFPRVPLEGGAGGLGRCEETPRRSPPRSAAGWAEGTSAGAVPVPSVCSLQAAHRPAGRVCAVWPEKWEHILP